MAETNLDGAWQDAAKSLLRVHMVKCGMTYAALASALAEWGIDENERNLRNKVARGSFSAAFFIQCLVAMGCENVRLDDMQFPHPGGIRKLGVA